VTSLCEIRAGDRGLRVRVGLADFSQVDVVVGWCGFHKIWRGREPG